MATTLKAGLHCQSFCDQNDVILRKQTLTSRNVDVHNIKVFWGTLTSESLVKLCISKTMDDLRKKAAASVILTVLLRKRKRRKHRLIWAKRWLNRRKGAFNSIMAELYLCDKDSYPCYIRMDTSTFEVSSFEYSH